MYNIQTPSPTFLPEPVLSQHGRQSDQNIRHSRSIGDFSMSDNLSSSHLSSASSMSENQDDSSTRSTSPVTSKSASRVTAAHAGVGSLLYTPTSLWRPSSPQSPVSQALPSHSSSSASTPKFDISNLPRPPTRAQQVVSEFQRVCFHLSLPLPVCSLVSFLVVLSLHVFLHLFRWTLFFLFPFWILPTPLLFSSS